MNRDHLPALKDIILWQTMDKTANALPIIQGNNGAAGSTLESEIDKALSMLRRWDDMLLEAGKGLLQIWFDLCLYFCELCTVFWHWFAAKVAEIAIPLKGKWSQINRQNAWTKRNIFCGDALLHPDWTIQRFRLQNGSAWFGISVGKPLQAFHISTRGTTTQNAVSNAFNVHSLSLVAFGSLWINSEMLSWHKLTMFEWALQPESQVSGCFRILEWQHVLAKHSNFWICHVAELVDSSYAMTHILPFIWSHSMIAYKCMIMHSFVWKQQQFCFKDHKWGPCTQSHNFSWVDCLDVTGELLWAKLDQIKTQCLISWSSAMASGTAGVWFRKCLRLHDNEALVKAGSQFMGAVRRWQNLRSKLSKIVWIVWFGCAFAPVRVKWYSVHVKSGFDTNHLFPLRYTQKASSLAEGGHWLTIVKLASDVPLSTRQPPLKVWCLSSSLIHTSKVL